MLRQLPRTSQDPLAAPHGSSAEVVKLLARSGLPGALVTVANVDGVELL